MKHYYYFLALIPILFFMACDPPPEYTPPDYICEAYEEYNAQNGNCELRTGFCATNDDCDGTDGTDICNANHKCVPLEDPLCNGRCLDQNDQKKGSCSVIGGLPVCQCDTDYLTSPNKLRCLEATSDCKRVIACGGFEFGECIADNDGNLECLCNDNYVQDTNNPLNCLPLPICSNEHPQGTCDYSCEECLDDGTDNWSCGLPEGARPCYGEFNDVCDPRLGWKDNPGCKLDMVCQSNNNDDYYCTKIDCELDTDCPTTYGEEFSCQEFTYDEILYDVCIKVEIE